MQRSPATTMNMPSMRPMVAPSPIPATMISQPSSSTMMPRPLSSSYGVPPRALVFDKTKRPNYPTDLRQQTLAQGGSSMSMTYPNPNMMSGTIVSSAGPIRQ